VLANMLRLVFKDAIVVNEKVREESVNVGFQSRVEFVVRGSLANHPHQEIETVLLAHEATLAIEVVSPQPAGQAREE